MSAAFGVMRLLPERRWLGWAWLVLAILIAVATVYCRYHYTADALAGFAIAVAATAVSARLVWRGEPAPRARG